MEGLSRSGGEGSEGVNESRVAEQTVQGCAIEAQSAAIARAMASMCNDEGVHLGAYVETKNANFAEGNTVSHLTYIGDADVGKYCNFGCGTVTCNYDGESKYRTTIGDYAFIGCNTNLVAPVKVGSRAFTAAGSTIGHDVPDGALGIERAKQAEVAAWGAKKLEKYVAKKQKLEAEKKND